MRHREDDWERHAHRLAHPRPEVGKLYTLQINDGTLTLLQYSHRFELPVGATVEVGRQVQLGKNGPVFFTAQFTGVYGLLDHGEDKPKPVVMYGPNLTMFVHLANLPGATLRVTSLPPEPIGEKVPVHRPIGMTGG